MKRMGADSSAKVRIRLAQVVAHAEKVCHRDGTEEQDELHGAHAIHAQRILRAPQEAP